MTNSFALFSVEAIVPQFDRIFSLKPKVEFEFAHNFVIRHLMNVYGG
jgi:hypothetical protein